MAPHCHSRAHSVCWFEESECVPDRRDTLTLETGEVWQCNLGSIDGEIYSGRMTQCAVFKPEGDDWYERTERQLGLDQVH